MASRHPDSIPRWAQQAAENGVLAELAECANVASEPVDSTPRLITRVDPTDGSDCLSAQSAAEVILLNQRFMQFAGTEIVYGVRRDFSDLRHVKGPLKELTRLRISPFLEGSFVIPGRLIDRPVEILSGSRHKTFTGSNVVERFSEVLEGLEGEGPDYETSTGMLQAIRDLRHVLRREARAIDFATKGLYGSRFHAVNESQMARVDKAVQYRSSVDAYESTVGGVVTAVDLAKNSFNLKLANGDTIQGTYAELMRATAHLMLGENVVCSGVVQSSGGGPVHVLAFDIEISAAS